MATYTDWMTGLYDNSQFPDMKLGDIVIPGTHDSGSFSIHMQPIVRTQDRGLGEQLEDGIRYFDLRIMTTFDEDWFALKAKTFYLVHNKTSAFDLTLEHQLDLIARFAADHPKEIIILNMNSFTGADTDRKKEDREAYENRRVGDLIRLVDAKLQRRIFRYDQHHLSHPNLSQIPVRAIAEADQNIIIISDFEPWNNRLLFWPGNNIRGSYPYTTYISNVSLEIGDRVKAQTLDVPRIWNNIWERKNIWKGDSQDDPVKVWSEKNWFDGVSTPNVKCDGFPLVLEKLLQRRDQEAMRHNPEETPPYKGVEVKKKDDKGVEYFEYFDLSRSLLVLEFGFSTLDVSDSVKVVNPYVLDLMKELEKGKSAPGPDGRRRINTRRQINVVAFDYYNHFNVLQTVVEMNRERVPMWRALGKLQAGISSELAVGRNQNGLPQAFAVGKDGKLWSNWEPLDGPWTPWTILREAPKGLTLRGTNTSRRVAVGPSVDGRLELFALGSDGYVWHTWQTERNGGWSNWERRGGRPVGAVPGIAAGKNKNGLLDLFVITGEDEGGVHHVFQTFTPDGKGVLWHDTWEPLGKPPMGARRLEVSQDSEGRLELIVLSQGSQLYRIRQSKPNSDVWEKVWKELGPADHNLSSGAFAIGRNQDGRLEVFAWRGRDLCHTWQSGNDKDWGKTWESLGQPPKDLGFEQFFDEFAVSNHEDGRLVVYAFNNTGRLFRVSQASANGRWGVWEPVSAVGGPGRHLQFGRTKAGAPILFTWDDSSTLWGYEV